MAAAAAVLIVFFCGEIIIKETREQQRLVEFSSSGPFLLVTTREKFKRKLLTAYGMMISRIKRNAVSSFSINAAAAASLPIGLVFALTHSFQTDGDALLLLLLLFLFPRLRGKSRVTDDPRNRYI